MTIAVRRWCAAGGMRWRSTCRRQTWPCRSWQATLRIRVFHELRLNFKSSGRTGYQERAASPFLRAGGALPAR